MHLPSPLPQLRKSRELFEEFIAALREFNIHVEEIITVHRTNVDMCIYIYIYTNKMVTGPIKALLMNPYRSR